MLPAWRVSRVESLEDKRVKFVVEVPTALVTSVVTHVVAVACLWQLGGGDAFLDAGSASPKGGGAGEVAWISVADAAVSDPDDSPPLVAAALKVSPPDVPTPAVAPGPTPAVAPVPTPAVAPVLPDPQPAAPPEPAASPDRVMPNMDPEPLMAQDDAPQDSGGSGTGIDALPSAEPAQSGGGSGATATATASATGGGSGRTGGVANVLGGGAQDDSVGEVAGVDLGLHPMYPMGSRMRGEQGTVSVVVNFDLAAHLEDARVYASSGYPALDRAAVRAVKGVRSEKLIPLLKGGARTLRLTFRFVMLD